MQDVPGSKRWIRVALTAVLALALPATSRADGGPILSDPELWAQIEEGQQIAVVRLDGGDHAEVDLFISMLDRTGGSHEVLFFLPLGARALRFQVAERSSLDFDRDLTEGLDATILEETELQLSYKRGIRWALVLGTTLINGAWTWPFWFMWSLGGCAPATSITPVGTYETESSQVEVYETNDDSDVMALIETTGLHPSVQETLARFAGQQIAVVRMQTQPPLGDSSSSRWGPVGQPGLHLSWSTPLVADSNQAGYAYPLGTGTAWARPIELTRVYVVASPDVDFDVQYPRLGADRSGFALPILGPARPHILDYEGAAHAVEDVAGAFGRIWRVTYTQSNAAEDVVITRREPLSPERLAAVRRPARMRTLQVLTYVASVLAALASWLVSWRYIMGRMLGLSYRWREARLYQHALGWALLYPLTNGVLAAVTGLLASLTAGIALVVGVPILLVTLLGAVSALLFVRWSSSTLGVLPTRAFWAYVLVAVAANVLYFTFAFLYAAQLGVAWGLTAG
jgi:hypothetical protein